MDVLTKRKDFLAANRGKKAVTPGFILQRRDRADETGVRVGFTASKKIGNAVLRNRAKRRMRELAREALTNRPDNADYVLIARAGETVARDFAAMRTDLTRALRKLESGR